MTFARVAELVSVVAILFAASTTAAAPFDPTSADWEGYADFIHLIRAEAGATRVVVTNQLDWGKLTPRDALIVVYPEHAVSSASAGAFVRSGGRLALVDDFGAGDALLESFDIRRVPLPRHPALALRQNPDLAIAEPGDDHILTRGVDRVVTNHGTGLSQPKLTTALRVRGDGEPDVPLALVADTNGGRLLAIGDPSLLMNSMLHYPGNQAFAKNVVRYLGAGHPDGRIVVVVRTIAETGAFAGTPNAISDLRDRVREAGSVLARDGLPTWILWLLSVTGTLAILRWLRVRVIRSYRGEPPRFTRAMALRAQGGVAGHAASLAAKDAYRGHAMVEWRRAFMEDLTLHFGLRRDVSSVEVISKVSRLGVLDADGVRAMQRVLLRMAEIDTMVATKQPQSLPRVTDDEVLEAGDIVQRVLTAVHAERRGT